MAMFKYDGKRFVDINFRQDNGKTTTNNTVYEKCKFVVLNSNRLTNAPMSYIAKYNAYLVRVNDPLAYFDGSNVKVYAALKNKLKESTCFNVIVNEEIIGVMYIPKLRGYDIEIMPVYISDEIERAVYFNEGWRKMAVEGHLRKPNLLDLRYLKAAEMIAYDAGGFADESMVSVNWLTNDWIRGREAPRIRKIVGKIGNANAKFELHETNDSRAYEHFSLLSILGLNNFLRVFGNNERVLNHPSQMFGLNVCGLQWRLTDKQITLIKQSKFDVTPFNFRTKGVKLLEGGVIQFGRSKSVPYTPRNVSSVDRWKTPVFKPYVTVNINYNQVPTEQLSGTILAYKQCLKLFNFSVCVVGAPSVEEARHYLKKHLLCVPNVLIK